MMWAGNAVVGRMLVGTMPPVAMNALRWGLVAVLLAPLAWRACRAPGRILARWPYLALIGMLGVGTYNALQYLALQTSTPINVTLIGASIPVWMMLVGRVGFGQTLQARQLVGAGLSILGVLLVLAQGQWSVLRQVQLVPGDLLMLLASLAWALYSWWLAQPPAHMRGDARPDWDWAEFLWVQVIFGGLWALGCSAVEASWIGAHTLPGAPTVSWWPQGWRTWAGLLFIALCLLGAIFFLQTPNIAAGIAGGAAAGVGDFANAARSALGGQPAQPASAGSGRSPRGAGGGSVSPTHQTAASRNGHPRR